MLLAYEKKNCNLGLEQHFHFLCKLCFATLFALHLIAWLHSIAWLALVTDGVSCGNGSSITQMMPVKVNHSLTGNRF